MPDTIRVTGEETGAHPGRFISHNGVGSVTERPMTIAIDGPAASGKSTVGQAVAQRLGYLFFDTGAMYRALTYLALEQKLDLSDGQALGALAEATPIEIEPPAEATADGRQYTVRVGDQDITWEIRHHLVDLNVSEVAAHPRVRAALKQQQRRIGLRGRVVMVGRDIGTVVMPDAALKIYLDASVEERARRRYDEVTERGEPAIYDTLLDAMRERDHRDASRAEAPMRPAPDAHHLDSDHRTVEQIIQEILALVGQKGF